MRGPALLLGAVLVGFPSMVTHAQTPLFDAPELPPNFNVDLETGIRLRPQFMARSTAAVGRYAIGRAVFERLIKQLSRPSATKFSWELRIIEGDQLNAYSSPEGTIYVETSLAQLIDQNAGFWAAILSHEISHVERRDWARRYLYQKSRERDSAQTVVLDDPGVPFASWSDSQKASASLGQFCRQLEIDADRDSLMLMARAGYHPHFVPALHHLLHAKGSGATPRSLYAMHPCWEERDQELMHAYLSASIEFEHRWPEWFASPGGNPPIIVFAGTPTVRKTEAKDLEIRVPMRCQNLAGAVEVVLHVVSVSRNMSTGERFLNQSRSEFEMREVTGCTSPLTTVTFTLSAPSDRNKSSARWADVSVFDGWGAALARVDVPKLPR
ncbi:MAG TPA: M48 family metalloprotease [Terriglobales bacterium]|nr:M48 family metalloprotease [Terriglobales bacterium]